MAFLKVSCLVILVTVGAVLSEDIKSGIQNAVDLQDDLEGSETIGIAKKLLLIKGLGLGGLALGAQRGGFGGFEGKFNGLGGANSLDYSAPAYGDYGASYVAAPTPTAVAYAAPAQVAYARPAPVAFTAPAPVTYSAPAPVAYQAPATYTYQAPAPVAYQAPAPVAYQAPAPVAYQAPAPVLYSAPVADVPYQPPVSSGYTGNLQVVGYLSPVQAPQPLPPPPAPFVPLPSLVPCEH